MGLSLKNASMLGLVVLLSASTQAKLQTPMWDTTTASNRDSREEACVKDDGTTGIALFDASGDMIGCESFFETQRALRRKSKCPGDCPGDAVCPGGDGEVRITPSGKIFQLSCGKQYGKGTISHKSKASFSDCVDSCAETAGCFGVEYAKVDSSSSSAGECHYLGKTQTKAFNNTKVDSALRMDVSAAQPLACPEAEGKIIVSTSRIYRVACGLWSPASVFLSNNTISTFEQCTDLCDATISCAFADYKPGSCYLKGSWDVPSNGKRTSPDCAWFEPIAFI